MNDPRPTPVRPGLWMRSGGTRVPALAAGLCLLVACAAPGPARAADATAEQTRPVTLAFSGGYRIFSRQLGLQNDAAFDLRLGLGVARRASIALDYGLCDPLREVTRQPASVNALRALARVDILEGALRPYVLAGMGGFLINFHDAPDYSEGSLTAGAGIERDLSPRLVLRVEGTADFYRSELITYDAGGNVLTRSARLTNALGTISAGLGVRL